MRKIISAVFLSNLLFSIEGVIIFNDQTVIEGDVRSVDKNSVVITPEGLSFPEELQLQNIDSIKINNGMIPIAGGKVLLFYQNGEFLDVNKVTNTQNSNNPINYEDVEYILVPNWSLNFYTGYPLPAPFRGSSFEEFDKSNIVYGLSVGSPYGFFAGDFYMNLIAEFAYYNFQQKNNLDGPSFGGPAFQVGVSPGFFIGNTSFSATACTGFYRSDDYASDTTALGDGSLDIKYSTKSDLTAGFITGGSVDIPLGEIIVQRYGGVEFFKPLNLFIGQFIDYKILDGFIIRDIEEQLNAFEIRITARSNLIQKAEGATYWIDMGISFGYEFDYGGHPKLPDWLEWPF